MKKSTIILASTMALLLSSCLLKPEAEDEMDGDAAKDGLSVPTDVEATDDSTQRDVKPVIGECAYILVRVGHSYLHTWIEVNPLGQTDTVYEPGIVPDESGYIGERVVGTVMYPGMPNEMLRPVFFDSVLACPGDSLYAWKDSLRGAAEQNTVDTVYWNYGPQAKFMDELVTPTVHIANKDEIMADMDTLLYGTEGLGRAWTLPLLDHFPEDSADWRIEVVTPGLPTALQVNSSLNIGCLLENKANAGKGEVLQLCIEPVDVASAKFLTVGDIPSIEGHSLQWRLIASNRLGFAEYFGGDILPA